MSSGTIGAALRQIHRLFDEGTVAGLPDAQLLDRFLRQRDGSAFEVLVGRHGPMVLAVCRDVLIDPTYAEDAFQATFLLLAQKAGGIRGGEALGAWLHRVARRVAAQANADAARRKVKERDAVLLGPEIGRGNVEDESRVVLHEELDRLSEKYRRPLVLCELQGLTHAQAAAQLFCGEATLRRRLAEGRNLLRSRLIRRGLAPALATIAASWEASAVSAPIAWIRATSLAAADPGLRRTIASALTRRVARAMLVAQLKVAAALMVVLMAGVGIAQAYDNPPQPEPSHAIQPKASKVAKVETPADAAKVTLHGRALAPDGQPLPGAKVYVRPRVDELRPVPTTALLRATSDADGRFRFEVERGELVPDLDSDQACIAAIADGYGPGWINLNPSKLEAEQTIRLAIDDIPVVGRVIDLEGRGVPDVRVSVGDLINVPDGDSAAWIQRLKRNDGRSNGDIWGRIRYRLFLGTHGPLPTTRTDASGRFRLTGLGRDRIGFLMIEGDKITQYFGSVITTDLKADLPVPMPGQDAGKLQGPRMELLATPGRCINGTVTDRETKKPLPGVRVSAWMLCEAITDDQGRYQLTGLPKQKSLEVIARADGMPYHRTMKSALDQPGLTPINVDFELSKGVVVEGRILENGTGKPVAGAHVEYLPFRDNPHLAENPGYLGLNNNVSDDLQAISDEAGRFRVVALPGEGLIAVQTRTPWHLTAKPLSPEDAARTLHAANFPYQMHSYQGLVVFKTSSDTTKPTKCDVLLEPGRKQTLQVVDPAGKAVAGSRLVGFEVANLGPSPETRTEFTLALRDPGFSEQFAIVHADRHLAKVITLKGDEASPMPVKLEPTGSVVGRLVDEDGKPRGGVELLTYYSLIRKSRGGSINYEQTGGRIETDSDGRFRLDNVIADVDYQVNVAIKSTRRDISGYLSKIGWRIKPGEAVDWGDVRETRHPQN